MEFRRHCTLQQVLPMCPWGRHCAGVLLRDAWQRKGPLAMPRPCLMGTYLGVAPGSGFGCSSLCWPAEVWMLGAAAVPDTRTERQPLDRRLCAAGRQEVRKGGCQFTAYNTPGFRGQDRTGSNLRQSRLCGTAVLMGKQTNRHYKDIREKMSAQDLTCKDFPRGCSEEEAMLERLGIPLAQSQVRRLESGSCVSWEGSPCGP